MLDRIYSGARRDALLKTIVRRAAMGEVRARVRLENLGDRALYKAGHLAESDIRIQEIDAVVDTGSVVTLLSQDLVEALGLAGSGKIVLSLADDRRVEFEQAIGLSLTIAGREMGTDCVIGPPGCEPLIGQIVLERLDLIVDAAKKTLTVRPESPYLPTLKMKTLAAATA
jgi:predicted aspartyl protease